MYNLQDYSKSRYLSSKIFVDTEFMRNISQKLHESLKFDNKKKDIEES